MDSASAEALLQNLLINEVSRENETKISSGEDFHQNSMESELPNNNKESHAPELNEIPKNESLEVDQAKALKSDGSTSSTKVKFSEAKKSATVSTKVYESGDRIQSSLTSASLSGSTKEIAHSSSTPVMESLKTRRKNAPAHSEIKTPIEINNKQQDVNNRALYLEELLWDMNCLDAAQTVDGILPFKTIHLRRLVTQELARIRPIAPAVYSSPEASPAVRAIPKPMGPSKNHRSYQTAFPHQNFLENGSSLSYASPGVRRLSLFPEELISSAPLSDYPTSFGYNGIIGANGFDKFSHNLNSHNSFHVQPAFWVEENEGNNRNFGRNRTASNNVGRRGVANFGLPNYSSRRLSGSPKSAGTKIKEDFGTSKRTNVVAIDEPSLSPTALINNLGIGVRPPNHYNSSPNSGGSKGKRANRNNGGKFRNSINNSINEVPLFTQSHKIFIPDHPTYNFIGRILGPRGNSVRRLESLTGCNILIRGKGSVKDPAREAKLRALAGWEHLRGPLHLLITAEDENEALCSLKLRRGVSTMQRLLTPEFDSYKRQQLIQLAIINGTYRS